VQQGVVISRIEALWNLTVERINLTAP
jgi:hypothetical protein